MNPHSLLNVSLGLEVQPGPKAVEWFFNSWAPSKQTQGTYIPTVVIELKCIQLSKYVNLFCTYFSTLSNRGELLFQQFKSKNFKLLKHVVFTYHVGKKILKTSESWKIFKISEGFGQFQKH